MHVVHNSIHSQARARIQNPEQVNLSVGAMDVAARFAAQLSELRTLWTVGRRHQLASLSEARCNGVVPNIGEDTIRALTIDQSISQVPARSHCVTWSFNDPPSTLNHQIVTRSFFVESVIYLC